MIGPMTRAEKAKRILKILKERYPDPPVPLLHEDAFSLLVAVLLSAQCTDESCLLYTSPSPRDRTRSRMPSSA